MIDRGVKYISFLLSAAFLGACSDASLIQVGTFLGAGSVKVKNTFGQLVDESGTRTAAHYVSLSVDPALKVLTPSTGIIEYRETLDGLTNCLVLKPKLRKTGTDFSHLDSSLRDKQNSLQIAVCNLKTSGDSLKTFISEIYSNNGRSESASQRAAEGFLNIHSEADINNKFNRLDVWAEPETTNNGKTWSSLGLAEGGLLQIAAYSWKDTGDGVEGDGERTYYNPMPYFSSFLNSSGITPAVLRIPEIAEVFVETSTDEGFATVNPAVQLYGGGAAMNTNTKLEDHARFMFRLKNDSDDAGSTPVAMPYEIAYELREIAGTTSNIRSHGKFHINSIPAGGVLADKKKLFSDTFVRQLTASITTQTSDVATDSLWLYQAFDPNMVNGGSPNTIDIINNSSIEGKISFEAQVVGVDKYPDGVYELDISLSSALDLSAPRKITMPFIVGQQSISSVEWVTVDGSALIPNTNPGGGFIIFPGKNAPGDPSDNKRIKVRATVTPPTPGVMVFFKLFDVDDPTTDAAPVDGNGAMGGDNRNAYPHAVALTAASGMTDAAGVVETFLDTSLSPGDNYRVGAHFVLADLNAVTDNDVPASNASPAGKPGVYTDLLTTWRKLHFEMDSMGAVAGNTISGAFRDIQGTGTALTGLRMSTVALNDASRDLGDAPAGNGRFENGIVSLGMPLSKAIGPLTGNANRFITFPAENIAGLPFIATDKDGANPATISGTITEITKAAGKFVWTLNITAHSEPVINWADFTGGTLVVSGGASVPITANNSGATQLTTSALNIPFIIFDDDSVAMPAMVSIASHITTAYSGAYILPVLDGGGALANNKNTVPFQANIADNFNATLRTMLTLPGANESDGQRSDDFWIAHVLLAFQDKENTDNDPDGEAFGATTQAVGVTPSVMPKIGSAIFVETHADSLMEAGSAPAALLLDLNTTVAHEVGHQFDLLDVAGAGTLMGPSGNGAVGFSASELDTLRDRVKSPAR